MSKFRRAVLSLVTAALTVILMTVIPQSASAYSFSPVTTVYTHPLATYCVKAKAGIDHVSGPFSGNIAYADAYVVGYSVISGCNVAHSGWARVRLDVQYWNGSSWIVCRATGWTYGQVGWVGGEFPGPTGPSTLLDYGGSGSCGQGYYRTIAFSEYGGSTGTNWVGGSVASPYEWVP